MKKAVIFDMDGVLIDSEPFYFKRRMDFFKQKGILPGSDIFEDYVGNSESQTWKMLVPDDQNQREQLHQEYLLYKKLNRIDFTKALRESVPKVLKTLTDGGISIALASSSPRNEINRMLSDCHLDPYFRFTISGDEVKESKPNPEIYLLSREALTCDQYFAVEDSPQGIASAKAADIYTIALKQAFPMDQTAADTIIDDLSELLALLVAN